MLLPHKVKTCARYFAIVIGKLGASVVGVCGLSYSVRAERFVYSHHLSCDLLFERGHPDGVVPVRAK